MFGYVLADKDAMSNEQQAVYRAYYCGVCHCLGANYGAWCRMSLSFDMTFLALFLDGFQAKPAEESMERCPMQPTTKHLYYDSLAVSYAADMNIALTWHKCRDDWQDDHNVVRLGEAKLFEPAYRRVAQAWPRQCQAIETGLAAMGAMEKKGELNPDRLTHAFGTVLGELFVMDTEDPMAEDKRAFGNALGQFIYLMDAVMDLKEDLKKERYNPLIAVLHTNWEDVLSIPLADGVAAWQALPDNRHDAIIENVLYRGVWIEYNRRKAKE